MARSRKHRLLTGEYRDSTRKDIAAFTRLADAVDSVDFLWTALTAKDVTPLAHGPHELWVTMQNTTKHVQGVTVQSAKDAKVQIELPSLVADCGWGDYTEACVSGVLTPATQLAGIMGGSDLITGLGSIDSAKGISFEQFIVDSYMWDCCKNYLHEVEISEEKIGLDR